MRIIPVFCLSVALLTGCYDSRWGQTKAAQQASAAKVASRSLKADDEAAPSDAPPARARVLRLRAWIAPAYGAQMVDPERQLADVVEDANAVTGPALGIVLKVTEIKRWSLASDDDLHGALTSLGAADPGDDVDFVAGFVGALPRSSRSFHDAGMGALPGKHIVVRAPNRLDEHDAIEKSFDELSDDARRDLHKRVRRHRAAAVFLHELGHNLGAVHTQSPKSIMFHAYDPRVTTFGDDTLDVMRAGLAARIDGAPATDLVAALRRVPAGVFVDRERDEMVTRLERLLAKKAEPAPKPAQTNVPETPSLPPPDRARFEEAWTAFHEGNAMKSWETVKPLAAAYPSVMEIQDLRCQVATNVLPFEWARKECDALMQLATDPSRRK